ncbi:MAG: phospholipase A [Burkholderiales bacterium]|nr:phospholipase A [Burkholderiales bacterium]
MNNPAGRRPLYVRAMPSKQALAANALWAAILMMPLGVTAQTPLAWRQCAAIADDTERLHCYDAAAKSLTPANPKKESSPDDVISVGEEKKLVPVEPLLLDMEKFSVDKKPSEGLAADADDEADTDRGWLARSWDLNMKDTNDRFAIRPYRANYFLPMVFNTRPNKSPHTPTRDDTLLYDGRIKKAEAQFQISLKARIWNDVLDTPVDFWVGYTQRSFWQIYNTNWSAPFRETDYEPEFIATIPLRTNVAWFPIRLFGIGAVHQSNGQSGSLSRSWNRVYAMAGFEHNHWSLLARGWYRIPESGSSDDNPDLSDYMGYGDLIAHYQWREYTLEALARLNPKTNRGALQLDFTFPISGFLRGYVRFFDGYGESLIDYNHETRSLGIGLYISDWKIR